MRYVLYLIIVMMLLAACGETLYVCPDGSAVSEIALCPEVEPDTPDPGGEVTVPEPDEAPEPEEEPEEQLGPSDIATWLGKVSVIKTARGTLEVRFSLRNKYEEYVAQSGMVDFRIVNNHDDLLYETAFQTKKNEFIVWLLPGEKLLAYTWDIPLDDIPKSTTSSGTAYLTYTTSTKEFETVEIPVIMLPEYTDAELETVNEEAWLGKATELNEKMEKGDWAMTLQRYGVYEPLSKSGKRERYFRADFHVKNIADTRENFAPRGLKLTDTQSNKYEMVYGGTLDLTEVLYPGVEREGSVLFALYPDNVHRVTLSFSLGYGQDYVPLLWQYILEV